MRGVVLELFRRTEERPLQLGGREVDAAPVGVGFVVVQPIRARTDDAAVDDERFEIEGCGEPRPSPITQAILEVFQHFDLRRFQSFLKAVGKADEIVFSFNRRRAGDDTHRAARMHRPRACSTKGFAGPTSVQDAGKYDWQPFSVT